MISRTKVLFICLTLSIAGVARTVEACACSTGYLNDRDDAEEQFAAAVFEGEVLPGGHVITAATREHSGQSVIVFRVLRSYKGTQGESIQVYDAMAGSDCGFGQPKPGERYFLYGFAGKDSKIFVEACTRTAGLEFAGPDMRYARGEQPTNEDLTPAGEKWRLRRDPNLGSQGATLRGTIRPAGGGNLSNVVLTVWEVDARGRRIDLIADRQKVNKDGSYEVRYISPGQYIVTAEDLQFTPTARFVGESGKIQLEQGQTHSDVNLFLHSEPAGQVTIRVIAPRELHDRVFVWLRDVQMDSLGGSPYKFAGTSQLNEKNTASFESIPYGLYDVYVMLTNEDTRKPSWTHDELQVKLTGRIAEGVVELRKPGEK